MALPKKALPKKVECYKQKFNKPRSFLIPIIVKSQSGIKQLKRCSGFNMPSTAK